MAQRWNNLLFMHWPVPPERIRALVPSGLELDLRDEHAWVSITPFHLSHLRARGVPPLPWISEFPELNVRTYVVAGGKPGVWFFSLDAGQLLSVAGARIFFDLPYYRAQMSVRERADGAFDYTSRRTHGEAPPARFAASYAPAGPVSQSEPGSLDHWLTERYCLYAVDTSWRVHRTEIHHRPWPLQAARVELKENTMASAAGITLPETPPRNVTFSRRLDVVVWAPQPVA